MEQRNKIPKIIHFCWLSGEEMPAKLKECIQTWKRIMPDYELRCWDMNSFDIHSVRFVEQACSMKKWAFAADYIRLYALYTCGGIYLDSDVLVFRRFDTFLHNSGFASVESYLYQAKPGEKYDFWIDAAMIASEKGNPFIKDCLDYYQDRDFIKEDGSFDESIVCHIIADIAENKYGFKRGVYQSSPIELKDGVFSIYPPYVFSHLRGDIRRSTYAIHLFNGSWRDKKRQKSLSLIERIHRLFVKIFNEKIWGILYFKIRKV